MSFDLRGEESLGILEIVIKPHKYPLLVVKETELPPNYQENPCPKVGPTLRILRLLRILESDRLRPGHHVKCFHEMM